MSIKSELVGAMFTLAELQNARDAYNRLLDSRELPNLMPAYELGSAMKSCVLYASVIEKLLPVLSDTAELSSEEATKIEELLREMRDCRERLVALTAAVP